MDKTNFTLFTPYYVNQSRLFDLYSILSGGFVEYEKISSSSVINAQESGKVNANASSGFGIFKIAAGLESETGQSDTQVASTSVKKVQTVPSVLATVLTTMSEKKHLKKLDGAAEGDFVNFSTCLSLNSIKSLLEMLREVVALSSSMSALGTEVSIPSPCTTKEIDNLIKMFKFLFGGLEVFCETENYAVIANISEDNLYLSNLDDILNTEVSCFAQVKKIHKNGTELLKSTTFSKIKNNKAAFIDKISTLSKNDSFDFGVEARSEISGKTVYEVEIFSLCKKCNL